MFAPAAFLLQQTAQEEGNFKGTIMGDLIPAFSCREGRGRDALKPLEILWR
jgi:hypothetical protein